MKAEIRANSVRIEGYVNVPGRTSRPLVTASHGRVVEVIEQRAFAGALKRAGNVRMLLDHNKNRVLAETKNGTLELYEDAVGLRAISEVTDPEVMKAAKEKRLRGWSFNMRNIKDSIEERADALPIRYVKSFDMDEVTLVLDKIPCYASTSVEVRSEDGESVDVEYRSFEDECSVSEKKQYDNQEYKLRIQNLEKAAE